MARNSNTLYDSSEAEIVFDQLDDLERKIAKIKKNPRKKHYQLESLAITCMKLSAFYDLTKEQEDKLREKRESYGSQMSQIEHQLIGEARKKYSDPLVIIKFDSTHRIAQDQEAIRANAILLTRRIRAELKKNPYQF